MSTSLAILLFLLIPPLQQGQTKHPNSPVFKAYSSSGLGLLLEQSDATYQMWEGFRVLQKANTGDVVSQFELSVRYLTGRGFKADTTKAVYWTKRAAEQKHLLAMYNLGIFSFHGWGTEWNPFESYRSFHTAAVGGICEAQYALAQFLTENLVVPRNVPEAYRWMKLAADSGYVPAKESLKEFERHGYGDGPARQNRETARNSPSGGAIQLTFLTFSDDTVKATPDSILADDVFKAAALSRSEQIQNTANTLIVKNGKLQIDSTVLSGLTQAAEAGSPEALTLVGRCYEAGIQLPKDPLYAAMYYVRAIRLDSPRASRLLFSLIREEGFFARLKSQVGGENPDAEYVWPCLIALGYDRQLTDAQARQMLERSAGRRHLRAMVELGLCYYTGRWVKRDEYKAEALWREAAALGSTEAEVRLAILKVRERKPDYGFAIPVLMKSAAEGSVLGDFALGYCFETGSGLPKNRAEAARRYRSSGQRGSQDAFRALMRMHDTMRPRDKQFQIIR